MDSRLAQRRLGVLARLGHRLPRARSVEEAATETVLGLASLEVASAVAVIESDVAVITAIHVLPEAGARLDQPTADLLVGARIPVDGIPALRSAVRLRRPYLGRAGAVDVLRSVTTHAQLASSLPGAARELDVLAAPVMGGERVLAAIVAWGEGCGAGLLPVLEAAAVLQPPPAGRGTRASSPIWPR